MTTRGLLFILSLYTLFVWLVSVYLREEIVRRGLFWTAAGVAALLVWLLIERIIVWRRASRDRRATRPTASPTARKMMHEDDAALANLLREANQRLEQAPRPPQQSQGQPARATDLPLYLLIGPEGSGKTAVLKNSGLDPHLLAGQVLGSGVPVTPTRVANLWLARGALFLEVGGRVFNNSDAARLAEFLSVLRPVPSQGWRKLIQPPNLPPAIRAVILFFDSGQFKATPELDQLSQQVREKLAAIGDTFGSACPVYVIFTKLDSISYFAEFAAGVEESESRQVLGVLNPLGRLDQNQDRVWAESETRRLNRDFNSLFLRMNDRRLLALAQESDSSKKPAIYEFPREFKRIRAPLVQFLVEVFKPNPLRPTPSLRGFFFTGTKKVERLGAPSADRSQFTDPVVAASAGGDPTQLFRMDPTYLFRAEVTPQVFKMSRSISGGGLVDKWLFISDFFNHVIFNDRPSILKIAPPGAGLVRFRKLAIGAAAGLAFLAAMVWTVSWYENMRLAGGVDQAIEHTRMGSAIPSLANLAALDVLRKQAVTLEENGSWRYHWGLYTGYDLLPLVRKAYFGRLKQLALESLNKSLATNLRQASAAPGYGAVYRTLNTHLTITTRPCAVERAEVVAVLNETVPQTFPSLGDEEKALLRTQFVFYATILEKTHSVDLPLELNQDVDGIRVARNYLAKANGDEQIYRNLLSEASKKTNPVVVDELVPNYRAVLRGPHEFPGIFTKAGVAEFNALVDKGGWSTNGQECVTGTPANSALVNRVQGSVTGEKLKSLYYRQYADEWRRFLGGIQVIPYNDTSDAVRKLDVLSAPGSPLLGIVKIIADNTNFPQMKAGQPSYWDNMQDLPILGSLVRSAKRTEGDVNKMVNAAEQMQGNSLFRAADVARLFQPVHITTTPGSERLANENNEPYIRGLRGLEDSLALMSKSSSSQKDASIPQTRAAAAQAEGALRTLADRFFNVGRLGVNEDLTNLLSQPIRYADRPSVIPSEGTSGAVNENAKLAQVCKDLSPILSRYPFSPRAELAASELDIPKGFAPNTGFVWKYALQSDLVVRNGKSWEPKPGGPNVRVTPELVAFLKRSQELTDVFFGTGDMMQPRLRYTLRPVPGRTGTLRIELDGEVMDTKENGGLRKTFVWPGPSEGKRGAAGLVEAGGQSVGFGRYDGLWGVFRLFQNADERPYGADTVQWSEIRGLGNAVSQPLTPPVRVQFVEFPGGIDLFNPKFFDDLRCPKRAVVVSN